jgi:uncharacterized protein YlzI (FlbEa/FlbD family)
MTMIQLRQINGAPILINAEAVAYLRPDGDGTAVALIGGTSLAVADQCEAVAELFDPERQAAEPC